MPAYLTIGEIWIDVSISERHSLSADVSDHPVERGTNVVDNIRPKPRSIDIEGIVTNHPIEVPLSHAGTTRALAESEAGTVNATTVPGRRVPPLTQEIEGEPTDYGLGRVPGVGQLRAALTGFTGGALALPRRRFAMELNHQDMSGETYYSNLGLQFTEEFDRVGAVYDALIHVVEDAQPVRLVTGLDIYDSVAMTDLSFDRSAEVGRDALRFSATCVVLRVVNAQTVRAPKPAEQRGNPAQSRGKQQTQPTNPASLSQPAQAQVKKSFLDYLLF